MNSIKINGTDVFPIGVNFYVSHKLDVFQFTSLSKGSEYGERFSTLEGISLDEQERKIFFSSITIRGKRVAQVTYFFPYSRMFNNMSWDEYKVELEKFLREYSNLITIQ